MFATDSAHDTIPHANAFSVKFYHSFAKGHRGDATSRIQEVEFHPHCSATQGRDWEWQRGVVDSLTLGQRRKRDAGHVTALGFMVGHNGRCLYLCLGHRDLPFVASGHPDGGL